MVSTIERFHCTQDSQLGPNGVHYREVSLYHLSVLLLSCIWQRCRAMCGSLSPLVQCDLSATDDLGRCSLHHSSQAGAVNTTELLVAAGMDLNSQASTSQLTPLHYAAKVCLRRSCSVC